VARRLGRVPGFLPAYLIRGDDHGRIAERRARLRAMAEAESGAGGVEVLEGEAAAPEAVAAALTAMTLALGRRFVIVEGAESYKDAELDELEAALASLDGETTTVAFFAREEGVRKQAPERLARAVEKAGGKVDAEATVKPWELPKWVAARARELGLELDAGAARDLVAQVGERQQRLLRELEKLALRYGADGHLGADELDEMAAHSVERKAWTLADAMVAGDRRAATRRYLELREQGERLTGLQYQMASRIRQALEVAERLEAGESPGQVRKGLRMPPKAADRFIADVQRTDRDALRAAVQRLADLERDSRGGSAAEQSEDTAAIRAILAITS
jgi:DNA polymerase-3 subunit delta